MIQKEINNRGFTLIELLVVLLILGVLAAVLVPNYIAYVDKGRAAADSHTLGVLNGATRVYCADQPSPNMFETAGQTSDALMQLLVDAGLLPEKPVPKQKGLSFAWRSDQRIWLLSNGVTPVYHELEKADTAFGKNYYSNQINKYEGSAADIHIPKSIDGVEIKGILQDAFLGKALTSISFSADSKIVQIHARAFKDNKLTEVALHASLQRLDYGAFLGNDITMVTIGAGVSLEGSVFRGNNDFNNAYQANGAGTYVFINGNWEKQ